MKKNIFVLLIIFVCFLFKSSLADNYNFYFAQSSEDSNSDGIPDSNAMNVKIINTSTYTVYDGNLTDYYGLSYTDLVSTLNSNVSGAAYTATLDYIGSGKEVLDFVDSTLTIRENSVLQMTDGNSIGSNYTYDRVTKVDVSNGSVTTQILVADSQAAFNYAKAAGFTVMLAKSNISRSGTGYSALTTFSANITNDSSSVANVQSKGGFVAEQIKGGDGATLFRQETDGTVHIGENSIVLSDERVSSSGNDEVYSSSGALQLGNNSSHRTIVKGALEIQDPKRPEHAANRRYVDGIGASSLASLSSLASIPKNRGFGIGTGFINGQTALSYGIKYQFENSKVYINASSSFNSTTDTMATSAGLGWAF